MGSEDYKGMWRFHPPASLRDPYTNDTVELTDDEAQVLLGNGGVVSDELLETANKRYKEKLADRPFTDVGDGDEKKLTDPSPSKAHKAASDKK